MNNAIGIEKERVFVTLVTKGKVHFTWEDSSVIVQFVFLERNATNEMTLLEAIAKLTNDVQDANSKLYNIDRGVTKFIDQPYGLLVDGWDISVRLTYPIEIIGGDAVLEGYYLNQGGMGICDLPGADKYAKYCEFERFFEDDVSRALGISYYRVQIMFIKKASYDASLIFFRINPPLRTSSEKNISRAIGELAFQIHDPLSKLYDGNVTIRLDPVWGISQTPGTQALRLSEARFTKKHYEYDSTRLNSPKRMSLMTPYDRCKQNRRCNWGIALMDQYTNDVKYYHQLYDRGFLFKTDLFLDFEDWRFGSRGFNWEGFIPPTAKGQTSIPKARAKDGFIRGSHFWPFDQLSLGPDIPCYLKERNQGLVLDRSLHKTQIERQDALIDDIQGRIDFLGKNIEWADMGAELRSRKDVKANLSWVRYDFENWRDNEIVELHDLTSSQCTKVGCSLLFDTTTLKLIGAINDTGVIRKTALGTEVAVFSFNSIYLGPEVKITIVGQRAISIISKTTFVLNTTIHINPGTLGGFQGGQSIGRHFNDSLTDTPRSIYICDLTDSCGIENRDNMTDAERRVFVSNNVNGPGSGNVRVRSFVVTSSAANIPEIQRITTTVQKGQTIDGGFILQFKDYTTTLISASATASELKKIIEKNLNMFSPDDIPVYPSRIGSARAGIGMVDVSRNNTGDDGQTSWLITFSTYVGNAEQLRVTSYLQGLQADVTVDTIRNGNELKGTFQLQFQGAKTVPINAYETAAGFEKKLLTLPMVSTAYVLRNDPTQNCDDGLCIDGPHPARGMTWSVYITTNMSYDDITPTSPTSPIALTSSVDYFVVPLISELSAIDANVTVVYGGSTSPDQIMSFLTTNQSFSLAFGGAGASYGGYGGKGYGRNPVAKPYNNEHIQDLLGGSGGCMKGANPFVINALNGRTFGRGGHGGGAIELVASNDIFIGTFGKISVRGEDGEQSSGGGGGGGSGGAILLAAGGVVVIDGELDISGGAGGYGGASDNPDSSAGGGGSGGRIAIFGQSITTTSTSSVAISGGPCGVYRVAQDIESIVMNVTINMHMIYPVYPEHLALLATKYVNVTLPNINVVVFKSKIVNAGTPSLSSYNGTVQMTITIDSVDDKKLQGGTYLLSSMKERVNDIFNQSVGYNIAQVSVDAYSIDSFQNTTVSPIVSIPVAGCTNSGGNGTYYTEAKATTSMRVRDGGVEGTRKALYFSNREETVTESGSPREAPFSLNGPILPFESSRPERVTFYIKLDSVPGESQKANFGALFSLLSRGVPGLSVSSVIGIFVGDRISHGANFGSAVDEKEYLKRFAIVYPYGQFNRWFKIDIFINWNTQTYAISVDDTRLLNDAPFVGDDVDGIRISVTRAVDVWFDEIYVGFDNTMNYKCPNTQRTGATTSTPAQQHWSLTEVTGGGNVDTAYEKMTRHYSHLDPKLATVPLDGRGRVTNYQDIKYKYPTGDYPITQGEMKAGALIFIQNQIRSTKTPPDVSNTLASPIGLWTGGQGGAGDGRQFWYSEYNYMSDRSPTLNGGIAACSSQDMTTWRFEGMVFHYANLSDMVQGSNGPFYMERPKVKYNVKTKKFVMWAVMDNAKRSLAMSMVAESPFEDGPFLFRRSLYPDGNQTRDQVIFVNEEDRPVLGRTYYQTIQYLLPEAIMQPTWESVKNRDGTINYRINYHRAFYDIGYDNYHDIYVQRWRREDLAWNVQCRNKVTGEIRDAPYGKYVVDAVTKEKTICIDPIEEKIINGQGNPVLRTFFISPDSADNSWWQQTSVPAVTSQPWASNYRDGFCGIRQLDEDHDRYDPELDSFKPQSRNNCSNIADNPTHPTVQDKLIGQQKVITQRRSKMMAVSELSDDFMDTTGYLNAFEGELDNGDLISMIIEMGQFGFGPGEKVRSTDSIAVRSEYETANDYRTRFRQYVTNVNDRALYSLACVIDGVCPVNYRDQLTVGNI